MCFICDIARCIKKVTISLSKIQVFFYFSSWLTTTYEIPVDIELAALGETFMKKRKSTFKITSWNSATDFTLPNVKEHAPIARKKSSTVWLNWALFNHNFVMLPKDENKYAQKNLSAIHTNWFSWFIKHFCSISNSTWCYVYVYLYVCISNKWYFWIQTELFL